MRLHLLSTLLLLLAAQRPSPVAAYMQQRPLENAPGPEDISAKSCEHKADAPIPAALESEPQQEKQRWGVTTDRRVDERNASLNEGECNNEEVEEDDVAVDDIR